MCNKARKFRIQTDTLTEKVLMVFFNGFSLGIDLWIDTLKNVIELHFLHDNCRKIIVCTKIEKNGIVHYGRMVGEVNGTH